MLNTKMMALGPLEKEGQKIIRSLSDKELQGVIQKAKLCFYDGPLQNGNKGLPLTILTAQKLIKTYPHYHLVGIGRTPSWLIEIAKLIDLQDFPEKYKNVAFSGRWYKFEKHLLKPTPQSQPTPEQISAYRHYLEQIHFTPQIIIDHDERDHRKTVLIDFLETGLSLYSFIKVLYEWADELNLTAKLQLALIIHDLSTSNRDEKDSLLESVSLRVNQFNVDYFTDHHYDIHWRFLAESSEKISGVFPVTKFAKEDWLNPPVDSAEDLAFQKIMRYKIIHHLHHEGYLKVLDWQLPENNSATPYQHFVERKKQ
jgi:hypothetical protein